MNEHPIPIDQSLQAWSRHDLDEYLELFAPDVTVTGLLPEPIGFEGMRRFYEALFAGFPDMRIERGDAGADGDKVAIRFRASGTHGGEFQGVAASNRRV